MEKRKIMTTMILAAMCGSIAAHDIDFDRIRNWTGTGPNRAALAIQFNNETSGTLTRVWGYRWEDGENPTGEDMFRAIAGGTETLVLFTQYTGVYGSTVCGIGYNASGDLLRTLRYDFDDALDCEYISFDYYAANTFMGQAEAPGDETPELAQAAIDAATETHVIQHPLDQRAYGYPAYDYDFWQPDQESAYYNPEDEWQSGWYYGYWSYWTGAESRPELSYSGVGYTGHQLSDGGIEGWSYSSTASIGEGVPPGEDMIEYVEEQSGSTGITAKSNGSGLQQIYTLQGTYAGQSVDTVPSGIYIVIQNGKTIKIIK